VPPVPSEAAASLLKPMFIAALMTNVLIRVMLISSNEFAVVAVLDVFALLWEYPEIVDALLDQCPPPLVPLFSGLVPSTMIFGSTGLALSGDIGVSSNSVTGVSGTIGFCLRCGRSSEWPLWLSRFECCDNLLPALERAASVGMPPLPPEKKLTWLGRGVPLSGRTCVQPSRNMSHKSQHAWTAEPRSSSSAGFPSLLLCRKLNNISARAQQARSSESVSSADSLRCFINRWHKVM
jgi:hypothetical protein